VLSCYLFRDLPNVVDTEDTGVPLLLIDTAGCNLSELDVASNESKGNEGEYLIIMFLFIPDVTEAVVKIQRQMQNINF